MSNRQIYIRILQNICQNLAESTSTLMPYKGNIPNLAVNMQYFFSLLAQRVNLLNKFSTFLHQSEEGQLTILSTDLLIMKYLPNNINKITPKIFGVIPIKIQALKNAC